MKKVLLTVSVVTLTILTMTSCKKVIDEIFKGLDVNAPEVRLSLPPIPFVCPDECPGVTTTTRFNLDSTIKANTAGVFGADDVKSIKIKQVKIDIPEANVANNLQNFRSARVVLSSNNSNTSPAEIVNFTFEDVYAASKTLTVSNSVELLPYLQGSEVSYTMYGRMRRPTTIPLTFVTVVTLRVE